MFILIGDKSAGKTTLLFDAVLNNDMKAIGNDHLIIFKKNNKLYLTNIPTYIPIKPWTTKKYLKKLKMYLTHEEYNFFKDLSNDEAKDKDYPVYIKLSDISEETNPEHELKNEDKINFIFPSFNNYGLEKVAIDKIENKIIKKNIFDSIRTEWIEENVNYIYNSERLNIIQQKLAKELVGEYNKQIRGYVYKHNGNISHLIKKL